MDTRPTPDAGPPGRSAPLLPAGLILGTLTILGILVLAVTGPRETASNPTGALNPVGRVEVGQPRGVVHGRCVVPGSANDCSLWNRPWSQALRVGLTGDVVTQIDGPVLRGYDIETGAQLWNEQPWEVRGFERVGSDGEALVVIDRKGSTTVFDDRGSIRWSVPSAVTTLGHPFLVARDAVVTGTPSAVDFGLAGGNGIELRSMQDGRLLWRTDVQGLGPAIAFPTPAGLVVRSARGDHLLLLDERSGRVVWETQVPGFLVGATDGELLLFGPWPGSSVQPQTTRLSAVDLASGLTQWERPFGRGQDETRAWTTARHVLLQNRAGDLVARSASTGEHAWTWSGPIEQVATVDGGSGRFGPTASTNDGLVVVLGTNDTLTALEERTGKIVWQITARRAQHLHVVGARLFVATTDRMSILDVGTGTKAAVVHLPSPTVVATDPLLIAGGGRLVRVVDASLDARPSR